MVNKGNNPMLNLRVINYDTGEIVETVILDGETLQEMTNYYTKWEQAGNRIALESIEGDQIDWNTSFHGWWFTLILSSSILDNRYG